MSNWIWFGAGAYLVVVGSFSKTLISESDVVASEEDRERTKANVLKRILVIGAGVASLAYGVIRLVR